MSLSFSLICQETKQKLCVGQGHHFFEPPYAPVMETFYSGEKDTMEKLHRFLQATQGKALMLVCDEHAAYINEDDWREFE